VGYNSVADNAGLSSFM